MPVVPRDPHRALHHLGFPVQLRDRCRSMPRRSSLVGSIAGSSGCVHLFPTRISIHISYTRMQLCRIFVSHCQHRYYASNQTLTDQSTAVFSPDPDAGWIKICDGWTKSMGPSEITTIAEQDCVPSRLDPMTLLTPFISRLSAASARPAIRAIPSPAPTHVISRAPRTET